MYDLKSNWIFWSTKFQVTLAGYCLRLSKLQSTSGISTGGKVKMQNPYAHNMMSIPQSQIHNGLDNHVLYWKVRTQWNLGYVQMSPKSLKNS